LKDRARYLGANFRFGKDSERFGYEGSQYGDETLPLEMVPEFLRRSDLSDWIFSFQIKDERAFVHSVERWHQTSSPAWLMAAITKAKIDSPGLPRLMEDAQKVTRSSPSFATVAYHLARLMIEQNKPTEARKLLDEILVSGFARLPISARNSFLEQRMLVATSFGEFLKFGLRRPMTWDSDGQYGTLREFMEEQKKWWSAENNTETREEYIRGIEDQFRDTLPWDERDMFNQYTADIINRHFPLDALAQTALSPELPDYIRESLVLSVWARAVLLNRRDVALKFAAEAMKQPALSESFSHIVNAKTEPARRLEELWVLLKHPKISVFVNSGMMTTGEEEATSWEDGWWHEPSDTEYVGEEEVPKRLPKPPFITKLQSANATKERKQIVALGDAETYLTDRVFEWAARAPRDPRIPEALYLIAVINFQTKYGNGVEESHQKAITLLEQKYANSPWTAKAKAAEF
ncbi:MAG TPA: hypothetical protein VJV05_04170, partial [Pyrinomonadaceae bacterium]|nr:hypothetical protein [Pyrinomonadaceae bacterium]